MVASTAYLPSTSALMSCARGGRHDTNSFCDAPFWTVTRRRRSRRRRRCARAATTRRTSRRTRSSTRRPPASRRARPVTARAPRTTSACFTGCREVALASCWSSLAGCADERVLSAPCTADCTARRPSGRASSIRRARRSTAGARAPQLGLRAVRELPRRRLLAAARRSVSCLSCHADGPTACTTCHGGGPTSNAHARRTPATASRAPSATSCRRRWDDDGHILHDGVAITAPAKVTFGARAALTIDPADRAGPPSWDGATCSERLLPRRRAARGRRHRDRAALGRSGAGGRCDRCHGDPPPSHARTDCATCHPATRAAHRRHRAGRARAGLQRLSRQRELAGAADRSRGQHVHDRDRRRRASGAPPGAVADLGADPVRDLSRRARPTIDAPGHIDSPAPRRGHREPRLGSRRADLRDRVLPRPGARRCGRRPDRSAAAAATASRRRSRPTRRR